MKLSKFLSVALIATALVATAQAGSIGRSSSSSRSSSSFSSSSSATRSTSSFSAPSKPAAAPAPGGIGGTSGSMGVRKSEVTAPVVNSMQSSKPSTTSSNYSSPTPTLGTTNHPVYIAPASSGFGSSFAGSLGGSMIGSMLGNALSRPHGTTVINGGGPVGSTYVENGAVSSNGTVMVQQKKSYGFGDFIIDLILFALAVITIVGVVWMFYKGFKMIRDYANSERGIVAKQPFNPTSKFWEVQNAFSTADVNALNICLGPDMIDEATRDLTPSKLTLHTVSHEVRLNNANEFSVWYKFYDDGEEVNQVWHFELHDGTWKLNGLENV